MELDYKCYSGHFVNKENVRSYGKIVKYNILKQDNNSLFLKHIFENEEVIMCVHASSRMLSFVTNLRENIRNHSQDDFKTYFSEINTEIFLKAVSKEDIFKKCWKGLTSIIPKDFFGINQNIKIFKNIILMIIYSMKGEHLCLNQHLLKWNYQTCLWNNIEEGRKTIIFILLIEWILKYLLSAMVLLNFYVTTTKLDGDERKLYYFHRNHWQSFYYKSVSKLIRTRIIVKSHNHSVGKVIRRKFSLAENLERKRLKKNIPKLALVLKSNQNFRPIVQYRQDIITRSEKSKIKGHQYFLRKLSGIYPKMEDLYIDFYRKWEVHKPKLYFVKTDLSNAFGSINRLTLMKILCETYARVLKQEKDFSVRKRLTQQYKDLVVEFRKPILVRCGSTVYEWREGLVQGYKYSPALSEIYYNYLDKSYFSELLENSGSNLKLFIRVVDDYLFITDSLELAHAFLNALSKYRNVNYDKTIVNFEFSDIKYCDHITFLGYSYNTLNLHVSRAINVLVGQMCFKIAFSEALKNFNKFLLSRIGQSSIPINGHLFNFFYNTEEIIWKHVFTTFCLSANKFCTILAIVCEESDMCNYLNLYKRVTVRLSNSIITTLKQNKPDNFEFYYCINHFRYLSFKALLLCCQKTPKCNHLVAKINDYLAKCDCGFGKWREHAQIIDIYGVCQRIALKEICKKHEYKSVVKHFDKLPDDFQCYNKISRM